MHPPSSPANYFNDIVLWEGKCDLRTLGRHLLRRKHYCLNMSTKTLIPVIARRWRTAVFILLSTVLSTTSIPRGISIQRQLFSFSSLAATLSGALFTRMYRMPKRLFFCLAEKLVVHRALRKITTIKSSTLVRLSVTLRFLAGGSYLDIALGHTLSISSTYSFIETTIEELSNCLSITFPLDNEEELQRNSAGSSRQGCSPLSGCCGALDGLAIKIIEPARSEVSNSSTYFNSKGFLH